MDKNFQFVLDSIERKIKNSQINGNKKDKYLKEIKSIKENYRDLNISDDKIELLNSIVKKGKEVQKSIDDKEYEKIEYYFRFCNAALYDFRGEIKYLNRYAKSFILTCILFLALSPMYFSWVLPILFIVPIYMGLKGLRNRNYNGFIMTMAVIPMGFVTSIMWIKNGILASKDFEGYIKAISNGINYEFTKNITIAFIILGVILFFSTTYSVIIGIKHRKMFV
ncbi:hypothetical protein Q428_07470 [Fervidicella metallireducens AeB]|uniref:Alpha-glucosidase n=1 Tax=Fervidicella metallireducens AeB TaxID=1403537 RepID=A0A017RUS5_9CLOT|nr:hypothetical protein [Fervidicella metallireducens]EYE88508.1 hypothetical protein Q428_07470 [Fervidicella metallireducens AeB]